MHIRLRRTSARIAARLGAFVLSTVIALANTPPVHATGQFTTFNPGPPPPLTQELFTTGLAARRVGANTGRDIFVGVATTPDGALWISDGRTGVLRATSTNPVAQPGAPLMHPLGVFANFGAAAPPDAPTAYSGPHGPVSNLFGLATDLFDGTLLYAVTNEGLIQIDTKTKTITAGPYLPPVPVTAGNSARGHISLAVHPITGRIYFSIGQAPTGSQPGFTDGIDVWIWSVAPPSGGAFNPSSGVQVYPNPFVPSEQAGGAHAISGLDGMTFDPDGNDLFLALPDSPTPSPSGPKIMVIGANGGYVNQFATPLDPSGTRVRPDGMAFHGCGDPYVASVDNGGTITKYVFGNGYASAPTSTGTIASGGFRGDLATVGADGYLYATQWSFTPTEHNAWAPNLADWQHGTRFNTGSGVAETGAPSIVRIGPCWRTYTPQGDCVHTPPGLADWWPFDETLPGTGTALDAAGSAPGTIVGAVTSGPGFAGNAFHFPAVDPPAYVNAGNLAGNLSLQASSKGSLGAIGDMTIDAWVKLDANHNTCAVVIDKHAEVRNPSTKQLLAFTGYQLAINNANVPVFTVGSGAHWGGIAGAALGSGWHQLAVTMCLCAVKKVGTKPVGGRWCCTLLVDGIPQGSVATVDYVASLGTTEPFLIGRSNPVTDPLGVACPFGGWIDEVEVFDACLNASQLAALVTKPKCKCRIDACVTQQVSPLDTDRKTRFRICNDGAVPEVIDWSMYGLSNATGGSCTVDGTTLTFTPSSGSSVVPAHGCVTVEVNIHLPILVFNSPADVACYQVVSSACGPSGAAVGSISGPTIDCVANVDTCFQSHGGWGNVPVVWTIRNLSPSPRTLWWSALELGAVEDSMHAVMSLNDQAPGIPTAPASVTIPPNGSAQVSVNAWIVQAASMHPTHLQLFTGPSSDSLTSLAADLSVYSDETSGARWSGWAMMGADSLAPSARKGAVMVYDAANARFVLFGGSSFTNETWVRGTAPNASWSVLVPSVPSAPSARENAAAIYDPIRHRMLLVGGRNSLGTTIDNVVYSLNLTPGAEGWSQIATGGPPARYGHTLVYDPVGDRAILYGGSRNSSFQRDAWSLSLSGSPAWTLLAANPFPASQTGHVAVFDPSGPRMLTFGGEAGSFLPNRLYALSLSGAPSWSALPTSTPAPDPFLTGAIAEVDSASGTMTLLGGSPGYNSEIWSIRMSTPNAWSRSAPPGGSTVSGRIQPAGPGRSLSGFFTMFGGSDESDTPQGDFLALPSARGGTTGAIVLAVPAPAHRPSVLSFVTGPNPFRTSTRFDVWLPSRGVASVSLYDIAGRKLRQLDSQPSEGLVSLVWDGADASGAAVRPGVYLVRVRAGGQSATGRVIRLR